MAEDDDTVAVSETIGLDDRLAIPLLAMEEPVLRNPHVTPYVIERGDRQLHHGAEPHDAPASRERLQGRDRAVPGPEHEDQAVTDDGIRTELGGPSDALGLFPSQTLQPPDGLVEERHTTHVSAPSRRQARVGRVPRPAHVPPEAAPPRARRSLPAPPGPGSPRPSPCARHRAGPHWSHRRSPDRPTRP